MAFETNWYGLQHFGGNMRILSTAEELEKFIGCFFQTGLAKMSIQRLLVGITQLNNLSVDVKTKKKTINYRI